MINPVILSNAKYLYYKILHCVQDDKKYKYLIERNN